jgi:hypothetical protein
LSRQFISWYNYHYSTKNLRKQTNKKCPLHPCFKFEMYSSIILSFKKENKLTETKLKVMKQNIKTIKDKQLLNLGQHLQNENENLH